MPEISRGMPQNEATGKEVRTRSRFPLSYNLYQTLRFADITPHFAMEVVPSDDVNLRSSHSVKSYTLGAPLLQNIDMRKDYFFVPMEAILPRNWDKFYTNPVIGDDVPDNVGPTMQSFGSSLISIIQNFRTGLMTIGADEGVGSIPNNERLNWLLHSLIVLEGLLSRGSLLSTLGYHLGSLIYWKRSAGGQICFDDFFDIAINSLKSNVYDFEVVFPSKGTVEYVVVDMINSTIPNSNTPYYNLREFLELAREEPSFSIPTVNLVSGTEIKVKNIGGISDTYNDSVSYYPSDLILNPSRLWAYQIVCAHFYSNDKVDYIYSAQLYRDILRWYIGQVGIWPYQFTMNGVNYDYDEMSGWYSDTCFSYCSLLTDIAQYSGLTSSLPQNMVGVASWFSALFEYRRSLRFYDYFSGSRTQPLAVGNVDVAVDNNNNISVIDVTRNIQLQRFLNSVNRTGRQISEYVKGLFGVQQSPDYHNPFFIGHTNDAVYTSDVENTGNQQYSQPLSVTSSFVSNGSKYSFGFKADRDGILLGVIYFDIMRNYIDSIERQFFHKNRFDMFNPYMQFIGDQEIYQNEINAKAQPGGLDISPFGYTLRHMEYKQRYSQAVGGFANGNLPGMCFIADSDYDRRTNGVMVLDPEFIRSKNFELDRFYLALTGYSLGSYFHFFCVNKNECEASRPMAFAPSIL